MKRSPVCTRCAEDLVAPPTNGLSMCGFCVGELRLAAARGLVFGAATNRSRPHLLARVEAIDALRRLGHSVDQVLHARARALDGASAEEIVELLTEPAREREALPV